MDSDGIGSGDMESDHDFSESQGISSDNGSVKAEVCTTERLTPN
jgi:hypothetical protein